MSGPDALCVGARRSRALLVGSRRSLSWGPAFFRRSLCRGPALSTSGAGALCVGARRSVSGPGTVCVATRRSLTRCFRARRSLCGAPTLSVSEPGGPSVAVRGSHCRGPNPPPLSVSAGRCGRSLCRAPTLSVCVGLGSLCQGSALSIARLALSVSGAAIMGRRCGAVTALFCVGDRPSPQLRSACHLSAPRAPSPVRSHGPGPFSRIRATYPGEKGVGG